VLESVTLAQVVELVVEVFVNLAAGTVLYKETAENSETAHPDNLAKFQIKIVTFNNYIVGNHTWAYEHPLYPSAYRNHGVYQFFEQQ